MSFILRICKIYYSEGHRIKIYKYIHSEYKYLPGKLWIKKISTQIEKNLWRPVSHNLILALKAIFKSLRLKKLPTDFDDLFFCFTCFSLYFNATVWYFQFYSYFLIYSGISCKKRKRKITFGKIFIKTNVIEIFNF